jgi:hypothetical protein
VLYWDQPFLVGWVFSCSIGEKPFLVDLVDQLFQPASNQVETVEKALAATAKDYSQELPRFNRKRLEKCSIEKRQPYQPKLVVDDLFTHQPTLSSAPHVLWCSTSVNGWGDGTTDGFCPTVGD